GGGICPLRLEKTPMRTRLRRALTAALAAAIAIALVPGSSPASAAATSGHSSGTVHPLAASAMAAPYLYMGWGDPPSATSVMSSTGIRAFTMAFMLSSGTCNPAWDGSRPLTGGTDQSTINAIKNAGGHVEVSFGGWSGNKLGATCSSASAL